MLAATAVACALSGSCWRKGQSGLGHRRMKNGNARVEYPNTPLGCLLVATQSKALAVHNAGMHANVSAVQFLKFARS